MEEKKIKLFNRLYFQISAIFLLVLLIFGAITLYISINSAKNYSIETNQRLNRNLAKSTAEVIQPFLNNGKINQEAIADIMHSMMVINPIVEVYLLDTTGKILTYVAPEKVVKLDHVNLLPIKTFLDSEGKSNIIYGDDPRNPGETKTFSAARILDNGQLEGYIYIVLASQEYVSTSHMVLGSYILGLSIKSVILILVVSAIVGLLAIWLLIKKLNTITRGIQKFHDGNLGARIPVSEKNELDRIGHVFNDMADTIQKNIQELKGLDNMRKELISNISHDLRTPVAAIQGYAETLLLKKDQIDPEKRDQYLQTIYSSCDRLKVQVSELFELSKLDTNQVRLEPEVFAISELVHDVANKYRIISQKKGISIDTITSKDIPLVEADISLIDRVLQNLLDNAVKFCRENDTINIEVSMDKSRGVKIRVSDTGIGIGQEELPHIFERYFKGARTNESTGLGLAIVKKIIDLHKSTIEVFSQKGQGTTFSFYLPVAASV